MMLALWQANDSINSTHEKWLMFFIGMVAVSLLANTVIFLGAAIAATKAQKKLHSLVAELHAKALPLIDASSDLLRDTSPKVKQITTNLLETSYTVRAKAQEIDVMITEANQKTRKQVARVDGMVTTALNNVGELSAIVHHGIRTPIKHIAGLVEGVKTTVESFVASNSGKGSSGSGPTGIMGQLMRGFAAGRAGRVSPAAPIPPPQREAHPREVVDPRSNLDL